MQVNGLIFLVAAMLLGCSERVETEAPVVVEEPEPIGLVQRTRVGAAKETIGRKRRSIVRLNKDARLSRHLLRTDCQATEHHCGEGKRIDEFKFVMKQCIMHLQKRLQQPCHAA